jgi:hypothetical protein
MRYLLVLVEMAQTSPELMAWTLKSKLGQTWTYLGLCANFMIARQTKGWA